MSFVNDVSTAQHLLAYRRIQQARRHIERDTQRMMDDATALFGQVDAARKAEILSMRDDFIASMRTILGV